MLKAIVIIHIYKKIGGTAIIVADTIKCNLCTPGCSKEHGTRNEEAARAFQYR